MLQWFKERKKAVAGGLVAAATWFGTAFVDGEFQSEELAGLPMALLIGFGVVAFVNNDPSAKELEDLQAWKHE